MNRMRHSQLHQVQEDSLIKSLQYTGENGDDDDEEDNNDDDEDEDGDDDDNKKYYKYNKYN